MLRSLLVGLDESEFSAGAAEFAIALAQAHQATVVGVAVVCEPLLRDNTPPEKLSASYKPAYEMLLGEAHERCQALLAKFSAQASAAGVAHATLEDVGLPAEQIKIEAQRFDVVILGQETHFNFETSDKACRTLQKLLHNPPRPVIAVPKLPLLPGEGVLIAYDGSVPASRSLHALATMGLASRGPVHLLTIDLESEANAAAVCHRAAEYLRYHDVTAHPIPIHSQDPPSQIILDEALGRKVSFVAMGAYGHAGIAEWLFGSTTKHILHRAPLPLFLYH